MPQADYGDHKRGFDAHATDYTPMDLGNLQRALKLSQAQANLLHALLWFDRVQVRDDGTLYRKGLVWPSGSTLATCVGGSDGTMRKARQELRDAGLLTWHTSDGGDNNEVPRLYINHRAILEVVEPLRGSPPGLTGAPPRSQGGNSNLKSEGESQTSSSPSSVDDHPAREAAAEDPEEVREDESPSAFDPDPEDLSAEPADTLDAIIREAGLFELIGLNNPTTTNADGAEAVAALRDLLRGCDAEQRADRLRRFRAAYQTQRERLQRWPAAVAAAGEVHAVEQRQTSAVTRQERRERITSEAHRLRDEVARSTGLDPEVVAQRGYRVPFYLFLRTTGAAETAAVEEFDQRLGAFIDRIDREQHPAASPAPQGRPRRLQGIDGDGRDEIDPYADERPRPRPVPGQSRGRIGGAPAGAPLADALEHERRRAEQRAARA